MRDVQFPPDVTSFYSFVGCGLSQARCRGTACFVARHWDPEAWRKTVNQSPRV
jgi:hypothetical protein